jgi:hypothetical protein
MVIEMKQCRKCGKDSPLSEYRRYISGTVKPYCPACVAIYQKAHRKPANKAPDYTPDCTQMRHPDPLVMEGYVQKMMKKYADAEVILKQYRRRLLPTAGACDLALERNMKN